MAPPRFLYFDLGNVLVLFTVEQMLEQMGEVAGVAPERVRAAVFEDRLQERYERGRISDREFYEAFCRQTGTRPDFDALKRAGTEIFRINPRLLPVVARLEQGGHRLGVLSNTCESHWEHCRRRFRILEAFPVQALSYRIGSCKPEAAVFRAAAELAGCRPEEIFFVDDVPGHVAAAQAAGFDAVVYRSAAALVDELRCRGIEFNL